MKIDNNHIIIDANINSKDELFDLIAQKAKDLKIVNSKVKLKKAFYEREKEGTTGMEHGFSIPHAKTDNIKSAEIIIVKSKNKIKDYESLDGSKIDWAIALLIPENKAGMVQMKMLSTIAIKLNNSHFRDKLRRAKTKKEVVKIFDDEQFEDNAQQKEIKKAKLNIVGITSCAAGIAHTYMARDNLIKEGNAKGYNVKIETQGASGQENVLTKKEIEGADIIVIASDIDVNLDRFNDKKMYKSSIHPAVKDASKYIDKAIASAKIYKNSTDATISNYEDKKRFLSHIMNGVSWMIPLLIAAAIFIAIPSISGAFVGESEIVTSGDWNKMVAKNLDNAYWKFMYLMIKIGWTSISLMFPIFAAFTAYSIGNKPAFIPGLIGGFLAKPNLIFESAYSSWFTSGYPFLDKTSGFWGALFIGIIIGYIIKYSNKYINLPEKIRSIKPMLILPFIGVVSVTIIMILVINPTFGLFNEQLIKLAEKSGNSGKYILALIIAPMTASDLGGPINKAAVTTMYNFYQSKTYSLTMRVIPTITPSIGLGIAALSDKYLIRRRVFDDDVRNAAPNSIILAFLGISEGGLPFVFKKPLITIPVNMLGGLIGAYVGILTNTEQWFPDSAIWAWPFATPIWGMLLAILVGSLSTALMHIYLRYFLMKIGKLKINAKYNVAKGILYEKK